MNKDRLVYFDIAKGIGIFGVIIGHHILCMSTDQYRWLTDWFWSFHMPMFFIISGYFIKPRSINETLIKASRQLIIPYYVTVFLSVFACIVILSKTGTYAGPSILSWLWGCLIMDPQYDLMAMWFLPALFFGKLIYSFVNKLSLSYQFFVVSFFFLTSWTLFHYLDLPLNAICQMNRGLMATFFLYVGVLCKTYGIFKINYSWAILSLMTVVAIFGYLVPIEMISFSFPYGITILSSIFISICIINLCHKFEKIKLLKPLEYCGRHSLFFLCCHAFLFTIQLQKHISFTDTLIVGCVIFVIISFFCFLSNSSISLIKCLSQSFLKMIECFR